MVLELKHYNTYLWFVVIRSFRGSQLPAFVEEWAFWLMCLWMQPFVVFFFYFAATDFFQAFLRWPLAFFKHREKWSSLSFCCFFPFSLLNYHQKYGVVFLWTRPNDSFHRFTESSNFKWNASLNCKHIALHSKLTGISWISFRICAPLK